MKKIASILSLIVLLAVPFLHLGAVTAATTVSITSPTSGASVNGSSFVVTGTATANSSISVKVNGTVAGTTTSDGSGNWSLNVTGQAAGGKTIDATASKDILYTNVITTSGLSSSTMKKYDTFDDSAAGNFSIFSGGIPFSQWMPNNSFTQAYGTASVLSSTSVFPIDLVNETLSNFTMTGSIPVPSGIAFNSDGSKVYISSSSNDNVHIYDTSDNTELSTITVGDAPIVVVQRPQSDEVWVLNSVDYTISVINTVTDSVTSTFSVTPDNDAANIAFSPDGETAYVSSDTTGNIYIMNADTGTYSDTIAGPGATDGASVVVSSDNKRLYAVGITTNFVRVFDLENKTLLTSVPVSAGPLGLALTSDDSALYVTLPNLIGGANGTTIARIDTSTNTVVNTIDVAGAPFYAFINPDSASASVNFTLTSASLADTGQNQQLIQLVMLGAVIAGLLFGIRQLNLRRTHSS